MIIQDGYYSSPTLWSALLHADGPVACLVEVSEPHFRQRTRSGWLQISRVRHLLVARDLSRELRLFGCDCALRVLQLYEHDQQASRAPRGAIESARRFAGGDLSRGQLKVALDGARKAAVGTRGKARIAVLAATATAFGEASDAAIAASWAAEWAAGRAERRWQRNRFAHLSRALFRP